MIHWRPLVQETKSAGRLFSVPASGLKFQYLNDAVIDCHGPDYFVLPITINSDGVLANKAGNKSAKPCCLRLTNLSADVINKDSSILFVGFAPVLNFTEAELHSMLMKNNIS